MEPLKKIADQTLARISAHNNYVILLLLVIAFE